MSHIKYRRVFMDGRQLYEVCEFKEEHQNGTGQLKATITLNVKKMEIDADTIRVTTFAPPVDRA